MRKSLPQNHRRKAEPETHRKLLRGARQLAGFIFGDEEEWRTVYRLRKELGLFRLGGSLCGRPETISRRITEHEDAAAA